MSTLIIAEAGVNHNGDIEQAKFLIDSAAEAQADIVKFQSFKASALVTNEARQAKYQQSNTGIKESQREMLERLELSFSQQRELASYCDSKNIEFLSTAFDSQSLKFLVEEIGVKRLKISSGDISNAPFLLEHAQTGLDIILSTGMASMAEIEQALTILAYGYLNSSTESLITTEKLYQVYGSQEGQRILRDKVTLLHCTSDYPAELKDVNLNAIRSLSSAFGVRCGYSDHTLGTAVPVAAVAVGAVVVEKHFTLSKDAPGPDHKASLEPGELISMVRQIRDTEQALGDGIKRPMPSEYDNRIVARKSLVAQQDIKEGEVFRKENLTSKRPGNGISPFQYWKYIGQTSKYSYKAGDTILEQ